MGRLLNEHHLFAVYPALIHHHAVVYQYNKRGLLTSLIVCGHDAKGVNCNYLTRFPEAS